MTVGAIDPATLPLPLAQASPPVARVLERHPDLRAWLERPLPDRDGLLARASATVEEALVAEDPDAAIRVGLRRLKYGCFGRLILEDLAGGADVVVPVTRGVTDVADALVHGALQFADRRLAARHGRPPEWGEGGFVAMALGKHGGGELNYSSDVDLILITGDDGGGTAGPRPIEARRFAHRLAQQMSTILSERTADGFGFRVDLDLRPDGSAGPPTLSLAAAELYYLTWGRTWERAAWIKARPAAGDTALGTALLEALAPFRYRRSMDFASLEALASMRDRIADAAAAATFARDLKRGRGGIREVEFFAQALQLVWAGRDHSLRVAGTPAALYALQARDALPAGLDLEELLAAWRLLRAVEHRLQWRQEAQTQRLPDEADEAGWQHLAACFGWSVPQTSGAIADARDVVEDCWNRLLVRPSPKAGFDPFQSGDERLQALREQGFTDPEEAAVRLDALARVGARERMSESAWQRFMRVAPVLVAEAGASADPGAALTRLEDFVARVGARGTTYALLEENPHVASTLVRLFASSGFLSEQFLAHPELLDALVLRGRGGERPPRTADELFAELGPSLASQRDPDEALAALRTFRTVEVLRVGLADLAGALPEGQPGPWLTAVARAVVRGASQIARSMMTPRHGDLGRAFAVIGLGSAGSGWMTYGSDLDLAFVYDDEGEAASDGERPLPAGVWAARWTQRVVTALSAPSREGRCYEVDLRLRPDGSSGAVVAPLSAFAEYYRSRSRPFERLALCRASVVASDSPGFAARVEDAFADVRGLGPEGAEGLVLEAREMRRRQREQLRGRPGLHLKRGRGGLTELEFAVSCLQCTRPPGHPARRASDPLEALAEVGLPGSAEARQAWLQLRRVEAQLRLRQVRAGALPVDGPALASLARALGTSPDALRTDVQAAMAGIARFAEEALQAAAGASGPLPTES